MTACAGHEVLHRRLTESDRRGGGAKRQTAKGGARDRCDLVCRWEISSVGGGGGSTRIGFCATKIEAVGGGGTAANSARQPMQHELSQPLGIREGAVRPNGVVWQKTMPEDIASETSARTAPTVAITLARAIAYATPSATKRSSNGLFVKRLCKIDPAMGQRRKIRTC
jgi:hypothetical protein